MAALIISLFVATCIFSSSSSTLARQPNAPITLGSSLAPSSNTSSWSSASGRFALGFYPKRHGFAFGIWVASTPHKTVIWTANRNDPPLPLDVSLNFTTDGRLILQFRQGRQISVANAPQPAAAASMLDSGNFVLYDAHARIIWQSFDLPTDTLVPGQRLLAGEDLVSSVSETDHSGGRFRIRMRRNGNLVQFPVEAPIKAEYAYWKSNTIGAGDNASLNLDPNGQLYLLNSSGFNVRRFNSLSGANLMYRATIDADGIFRLYSRRFDDYKGNWSVEWSTTTNRCAPLGVCGLNGYCIPVAQVPACHCPPGFEFSDPKQKHLGCQRIAGVDRCTNTSCIIREINDLEWEDKSYSVLSPRTKPQCSQACLQDPQCEAVIYKNQECRKQELPLRFGRLVEQRNLVTTLIKVSMESSEAKSGGRERKGKLEMGILITGIVLSTLAVLLLALALHLVYRYRLWEYKNISSRERSDEISDVTLRAFTYDELKRASSNFRDEIGRGSFGTVFKGVTSNGSRVVAIKRLDKVAAEGEREFRNEMKAIGITHHKNLLRLLGYCHEGAHRLLVYEYMSNGSLADFLFRSESKPRWEQRIEIALSIARGLLYLHQECETQIIHCDIKPENILMDGKGRAKIADFGLSKILMSNQSRTYTGVRGTRGYLAPEWHRNSPITAKADVYSFGIVLLEIICCPRSVDMEAPENEQVLADWVADCFVADEIEKLVQDEGLEKREVERAVKVGLWCIQESASQRPSMMKVVLMLEGTIDIPTPPDQSL